MEWFTPRTARVSGQPPASGLRKETTLPLLALPALAADSLFKERPQCEGQLHALNHTVMEIQVRKDTGDKAGDKS
eukprot:scaffold75398_cov20-Prasinocladus_malaysianus.AAC.2